MPPLTIYLWSRLDNLIFIFALLATGAGCGVLFGYLENKKEFMKNSVIICVITLIIAMLIPSKKDVAMIYLLPKFANNQKINILGDKGIEALESYLNSVINKGRTK